MRVINLKYDTYWNKVMDEIYGIPLSDDISDVTSFCILFRKSEDIKFIYYDGIKDIRTCDTIELDESKIPIYEKRRAILDIFISNIFKMRSKL